MCFFMQFSIIAIFSARFLQHEENTKHRATSSEHFLFQNSILPLNQEIENNNLLLISTLKA